MNPRTVTSLRGLATAIAVWAFGNGCVYYNGVYNAKAAAHRGDLQLRADAEGEASTQFQRSAEKAESVLARHPKSAWRVRALYLAGRGAAFSGQCDRALPRLDAFLRASGERADDGDRARAMVAIGACELQTNHVAAARSRLDSLARVRDPQTASDAKRWAARAALADGDRDAAAEYLGGAGSSALDWELLSASLAASDFSRAESLMVARAGRSEFRDDVVGGIRQLWIAGRGDAAERVVQAYDLSRIRDVHRVALHYTMGDLQLRAGRDSAAHRHLLLARDLAGRDTAVAHESAARLLLLGVPAASSIRDVDSLFALQDSVVRRSKYSRRLSEQVLLVRLLLGQREPNGASLFLAAEVARDSLRAPGMARTYFLQVAKESPASPLAPRAWHAAALLTPDSASAWNARVLSRYASSSVARWLRGEDPAASPDYVPAAELLRFSWDEIVRAWSDSVRKLRVPTRTGADATRK